MPKTDVFEGQELGVLEDKTEALTLHSKRTERARKKQTKRATRVKGCPQGFLDILPYELAMEILTLLKPSDLFRLKRTSKAFYSFISHEEASIARAVSSWRYRTLVQSFRLPVLLVDVNPAFHHLLLSPERQEVFTIHKKPYQHIEPGDPTEVCTCLTCMLRWSALSIIVDFAHWQRHLDQGEPIPTIPHARLLEWNQTLIATHSAIVRKALYSPLWHVRLLEVHLNSTTRSIRRNTANKGNKRRRFRMTDDDEKSGTDAFLSRSGPPSIDFPYHRDNYYLLEAFVPNRSWIENRGQWLYVPSEQHDMDIEFVIKWAERRKAECEQQTEDNGREQTTLTI